jgi:hypothetical protein
LFVCLLEDMGHKAGVAGRNMMRKKFWIVFVILVIYTFGIRGS